MCRGGYADLPGSALTPGCTRHYTSIVVPSFLNRCPMRHSLPKYLAVAFITGCAADTPVEPRLEQPSFAAVANRWRTRAPIPRGILSHTAVTAPNTSGVQIL